MAKKAKTSRKVSIRMYCLGTGDCFVLKFYLGRKLPFTMMIDCGSCRGDADDFRPYLDNLSEYVKDGIDLLIVTHEHQDHVNGFHKGKEIFKDLKIKEAWFAWTENPNDPEGRAAELKAKREKLRNGFASAMKEFAERHERITKNLEGDFNQFKVSESTRSFMSGLNTLAEINLPERDEPFHVAEGESAKSLAGMAAIKTKLKQDGVQTMYLNPGDIRKVSSAPGIKFYVLGPPYDRDAVFKDGKQGKDVYKKYLAMNQSILAAETFSSIGTEKIPEKDLPFDKRFILDEESLSFNGTGDENAYKSKVTDMLREYATKKNAWRAIDHDWLTGVGSLALRLNSHINNTSLALAIEVEDTGEVILFPGDAEFGSWESWHLIKKWENKGKTKKHLAEDLLSRTVFYKVAHHLSYNGTALEKGINMMPGSGMAAMVTLDRTRISENWKSTMPNKLLLQDLIKRCDGKVFIMNETQIKNAPSTVLDPKKLKNEYEEHEVDGNVIYKQFTLKL